MRLDLNTRCCPPFSQPQPLSFRRCTHKLAEMPRWLSSNKMVRTFSHATCTQFFLSMPARVPFAGNRQGHSRRCAYVFPRVPRRRACMCTELTPPFRAQTTPPCCFGRAWASPPTARTRPSPRTSSTPSSTGPASATFRATPTLSTTPTPTTSSWPSTCRVAAPRSLPSAGHPAAQRHRGHSRLGPAPHKGVLLRYASNARGQFPSRSPR